MTISRQVINRTACAIYHCHIINDAMMASKRRCKINLLSLSFVSKIISKSLVIKSYNKDL